jgi:hypothetical protein
MNFDPNVGDRETGCLGCMKHWMKKGILSRAERDSITNYYTEKNSGTMSVRDIKGEEHEI